MQSPGDFYTRSAYDSLATKQDDRLRDEDRLSGVSASNAAGNRESGCFDHAQTRSEKNT
jgi:hypothetical protein